ncbi:MFS general substrate transporter [Calocera viscosa TUFC12733]|uniref:MFS general substrate transporter n=1 Tax=Calocera viscosa (strain TUFC12733) TaxID=1330018 RepID=A0A167RCB5_CALVF|nr:MFS general substrate transporter [Calocera viscosa TUFC12733]
MQRATRSAAPSAAANTSHSTPIKTPAKRGRKPKLPSQTSPPETDKQDQPSIDQPTLAPQEETRDSPEPQQSTQEVDSLELVEKVIDLDENEVPVLMSSEEAQMILDVLEKIDADGLLDQSVNVAAAVFSQSSSDQHEVSSTLRSLLDQSNDVSLRHIYKAAQNFTIRVAPKSRRRSAVSERTKRFCDLLHQLLLELIQSKGAVFGERVNLDVLEKEMKQPPTSTPYYALFQQLGQAGTYFSSAAQLSREQLAKLSLGQAETVAVVPTQLLPSSDLPTLGSLVAHRVTKTRPADPLSTVKRLPYDPFASFAPTYATEAAHIEPYESILARQAAANFRTWEKLYWPNFRRIREARVANRSRKSRSGKVDRESSKSQKRAREMDDEESDRVKRRKIGNGSSTPREEIVALFSASATDPPMPIADESAAPAPNELVIDPSLLEADLLQEVESVLGPGVGMCQIDQLLEENTEALQALRTLQDTRLRADARLNDESAECQLGSLIMFMLAPNYALMLLARAIQGAASSVIWTVGIALVCDVVPSQRIGQQLGLAVTGLSLGTVAGPPLGGVLYQRFGFYAPFILGIALAVLDLMARLVVIEPKAARRWHGVPLEAHRNAQTVRDNMEYSEGPPECDGIVRAPPQPSSLSPISEPPVTYFRPVLLLLSSTLAWTACFNTFVYGLIFGALDATLPLHLWDEFGFTSQTVGIIYIAAIVPTAFSGVITGWISDRTGSKWITVAFELAAVPWFALLTLPRSLALFIASLALGCFFSSGIVSPVMSDLAAVARDVEGIGYAHVYGTFNLAFSIAVGVGPVIGSQMYDHLDKGWSAVCLLCLASIAAGVAPTVIFASKAPAVEIEEATDISEATTRG